MKNKYDVLVDIWTGSITNEDVEDYREYVIKAHSKRKAERKAAELFCRKEKIDYEYLGITAYASDCDDTSKHATTIKTPRYLSY